MALTMDEYSCSSADPSIQLIRALDEQCVHGVSFRRPSSCVGGEPYIVPESITHCLEDLDGGNALAIDGAHVGL
jgi:hypothetical protein